MKLSDIDHIYNLLVENERIMAIKAFRTATNCHLKEAKDFVTGLDGRRTPDEFRAAAIAEYIPSPAELIAEFAVHVRRLEQIIVQFAELADGFQPETPQAKAITVGCKVKVLKSVDWPEYAGSIGEVKAHDARDRELPWHVSFDDGEYIWFHDDDLEVTE